VLTYAHDASAGAKRATAIELLTRLWADHCGVLSVQVLQELFVTLTRKMSPALSAAQAREIVADFATWRVVEPTSGDVLAAIDASVRWGVSFWDAMVITAAGKAQATVLWTEDLNDGQVYDGVAVRNPFRRAAGTQAAAGSTS
jgi:predicted nucleic acid-binding protein